MVGVVKMTVEELLRWISTMDCLKDDNPTDKIYVLISDCGIGFEKEGEPKWKLWVVCEGDEPDGSWITDAVVKIIP